VIESQSIDSRGDCPCGNSDALAFRVQGGVECFPLLLPFVCIVGEKLCVLKAVFAKMRLQVSHSMRCAI